MQRTSPSDAVVLERFAAATDTDGATEQTIGLMCRYISESANDSVVQNAAQWAAEHYGRGSNDPAMLAWAVFWFVKHQITFVVDESPMLRLGRPSEQDLLISPAVLIRMDDPREDCDGFTMLVCALLKALGIPFVIVTIAADPHDRSRWSHVFPMAMLPTGPIPLDASHGSGPGWMVPASHTFRWQCWDCDGKPVNIQRPRKHSLNGWVRTGLGQDYYCDPTEDPTCVTLPSSIPTNTTGALSQLPTSSLIPGGAAALSPSAAPIQTVPIGSSSSSITSPAFNWTSFLNTLTSSAAGVAKVAETNSLANNASLALSGLFQSVIPLILIVVVGSVVIHEMENH